MPCVSIPNISKAEYRAGEMKYIIKFSPSFIITMAINKIIL